MKIGELAGRSGLNASAIRYYETRGLLSAPHRAGGQRRYSADALDRALLIRVASEMGFTLSEIKVFLNGLRETIQPQRSFGETFNAFDWERIVDENEAACAADATREVAERWLPNR
jgi:MerR family redox-sensitive transcriptional activator SoxR